MATPYTLTSHQQNNYDKKYVLQNISTCPHLLHQIQSVFEDLFTGVSYSVSTDSLSVTDTTTLQQSLTNYLNDTSIDINSKVFLAQTIWMLNTTSSLAIDTHSLSQNITDTISHDVLSQAMQTGMAFVGTAGDDIFTCKIFRIQKALHVETNTKPKEEDNGLNQEVA